MNSRRRNPKAKGERRKRVGLNPMTNKEYKEACTLHFVISCLESVALLVHSTRTIRGW